jgi:hypothetical protein
MSDKADDAKPEPVPFPVDVTVNGVRVVTLMLRPGTTVTAAPLTVESPQPDTVPGHGQASHPRKS